LQLQILADNFPIKVFYIHSFTILCKIFKYMSEQVPNQQPPFIAFQSELQQLDELLDTMSHKEAKKVLQWFSWVRKNRSDEAHQEMVKQKQKELADQQANQSQENGLSVVKDAPTENTATDQEQG
jgi:hypothetical protein